VIRPARLGKVKIIEDRLIDPKIEGQKIQNMIENLREANRKAKREETKKNERENTESSNTSNNKKKKTTKGKREDETKPNWGLMEAFSSVGEEIGVPKELIEKGLRYVENLQRMTNGGNVEVPLETAPGKGKDGGTTKPSEAQKVSPRRKISEARRARKKEKRREKRREEARRRLNASVPPLHPKWRLRRGE